MFDTQAVRDLSTRGPIRSHSISTIWDGSRWRTGACVRARTTACPRSGAGGVSLKVLIRKTVPDSPNLSTLKSPRMNVCVSAKHKVEASRHPSACSAVCDAVVASVPELDGPTRRAGALWVWLFLLADEELRV